MSNEAHYDYYLVNKEISAAALKLHKEKFGGMRKAAQEELLATTGAIAWRESTNWGEPDYISQLVYPRDHEIQKNAHIKIESRDYYQDQRVICVRGKMNSKAGKDFNGALDVANAKLRECLTFQDWIIHEYFKVKHCGLGGPGKRIGSTSMLSTFGGMAGENIVIAIPKDTESSNKPVVPDSFEAITYGKFYDLTNK